MPNEPERGGKWSRKRLRQHWVSEIGSDVITEDETLGRPIPPLHALELRGVFDRSEVVRGRHSAARRPAREDALHRIPYPTPLSIALAVGCRPSGHSGRVDARIALRELSSSPSRVSPASMAMTQAIHRTGCTSIGTPGRPIGAQSRARLELFDRCRWNASDEGALGHVKSQVRSVADLIGTRPASRQSMFLGSPQARPSSDSRRR